MAKYKLPTYMKICDTIHAAVEDKSVVAALIFALQLYSQHKISSTQLSDLLDRASEKILYLATR